MELVVRKNDLLRELQLFQGIVERKNTIPILANVLMEAKGEEVRFLATDLEVGLRSKCAASVAKSGSLTLPAKKFYEIVKSLPETDIRIAEDKGGVKVGRRSVRFAHADAAARGLSDAARVGRRRTRRRCRERRSEGDGRQDAVRHHRRGHALLPERRAVRLRPDSMSLVATDGHRLALVSVPRDGQPAEGCRRDQGDPAEEDARRARRGC